MPKESILPGSIYDCEVIFTDTLGSKTRPVIILSGEIFPNCPKISNSDFENGGLKKPLSYLNVLKPAGVDFSQIKNYRGTLKSSKFTEIKRILVQKHSLIPF